MGKIHDKWLLRVAADFREGVLGGRSSQWMCAAVSWPLTSLLHAYGVECEAVESDLGEMNHVWIKLADGRALDPTADQFNAWGFSELPKNLPPVYLGPPLSIHPQPTERPQL